MKKSYVKIYKNEIPSEAVSKKKRQIKKTKKIIVNFSKNGCVVAVFGGGGKK